MICGNIGAFPYAAVPLADLLDAVFAALAVDSRGTLRDQPSEAVH